jgi:hypothetical protein
MIHTIYIPNAILQKTRAKSSFGAERRILCKIWEAMTFPNHVRSLAKSHHGDCSPPTQKWIRRHIS